MASRIETALDNAAASRPNPGRVAVHRLNRVEYANSIRDLLGLEIDGRSLLPADDSNQESFDNIASVLSVSPVLLEGYLSAASRVSRLAVGDSAIVPLVDTYQIPKALVQDDRTRDDLPFGSQGGTVVRHHFPVDGEYSVKVLLRRELYYYIIGMGDPHQIEIRLDGALLKRFDIGGEGKGRAAAESFIGQNQGDPEWEVYMQTADAGLEVRLPVKAGTREVSISFVRQYYEPTGILQPPQHGFARATNELYHGHPAVDVVLIGGPYSIAGPGDTPSRRRVFVCRPGGTPSKDDEACATQILSTLARRAYRRPVTEKDLGRLLSSYKTGHAAGGFEAGIQHGLERMLVSPSFLFRIEQSPANRAPGTVYRLSDLDLASRLSFFLWSSIPDDELLDVAIRGKLGEPAVLAKQVRRMLADPRSQALVDNFATQWLSLGKLAGIVPDVDVYPEFDENLREAMQQETRRFIGSQLREDRSVMELLTANYTFLNERLAQHYGIPNVYGSPLSKSDARGWKASRLARPRQHADGHVVSEPNLARAARQVGSRKSARRAAAAAARRCSAAEGSPARTGSLARFVSGWSSIGRTLPARRVISGWTRWGSRSRISTAWENGAAAVTVLPSMPRRFFPTARSFRA